MEASRAFVRVYVDCTKSTAERDAVRKKYGVNGYPTVVYLDPSGAVIERAVGCRGADEVKATLRRIAADYPEERRRWKALEDLPELRDWIGRRIEELGDPRVEVREKASRELKSLQDALDAALQSAARSSDEEIRARAEALRRRPEPAPIVVPVRSHSTRKAGGAVVEYECTGAGFVSYKLTGVAAERVLAVNSDGRAFDVTSTTDLPKDFGVPKELWIYPRK